MLCRTHYTFSIITMGQLPLRTVNFIVFFAYVGYLMSVFVYPLSSGLLCDLLWSDPDKDVRGWGENDRGVSFTFGPDIVTKFNNRHDLDLVCRAHQVCVVCVLCVCVCV